MFGQLHGSIGMYMNVLCGNYLTAYTGMTCYLCISIYVGFNFISFQVSNIEVGNNHVSCLFPH